MKDILQGVLMNLGEQGVKKVAENVGLDPEKTANILGQVAPVIVAGIANNAKGDNGAKLVDMLSGMSFNNNVDDFMKSPDLKDKAAGLALKALGNNKDKIVNSVSQKLNVDPNTTNKVVEIATPLILNQIKKRQEAKQETLESNNLLDLFKNNDNQASENSGTDILDLVKKFVDKDGDGVILDDILDLAKKYLNNK